ncbi:calcium-binding protein, partial [Microcoleus sp. D2B6]
PHRPQKRASSPQNSCDPIYPDVCIPRAHLMPDCSDISQRRFRVLEADPHGFDRDNDGIDCKK